MIDRGGRDIFICGVVTDKVPMLLSPTLIRTHTHSHTHTRGLGRKRKGISGIIRARREGNKEVNTIKIHHIYA